MTEAPMRRTHPLRHAIALKMLLASLGVTITAAGSAGAQTVEGRWYGILEVEAQKLRVVVNLEPERGDTLRGTLRSVDQGGAMVPLSSATVKDMRLTFEAPSVLARYAGTIDSSWTTVRGTWSQGGATFVLTLTRAIPRRDSTTATAPRPALEVAAPAADQLARIDSIVDAERRRHRIPGMSIAVAKHNVVVLERGYGLADVRNAVPATEHTSYRTASIAKPITAVAALQLARRGALDLDAPVQRYVPSFPAKRWPVTARHLLSHTSGIRHYRSGEFLSTKRYPDIAGSLSQFSADPLLFEPGSSFLYSTFGYVLLGAAIEGASGATYAQYVTREIFAPAGMPATQVDDAAAIVQHRAAGYRLVGDSLRDAPPADVSNKIPAGGLRATAGDLARFAIALATDALLPTEMREVMWSPSATARDGQPLAGLGWRLTMLDGRREVWHDGTQPQVSTVLYLRPDQGTVVAIMANLEGVDLLPLARLLASAAER